MNINRIVLRAGTALAGVALAGCVAGGSVSQQGVGTVGGAVVGGLLGNSIGSGSGRVAATFAGAAIGGVIGNAIGAELDAADRQRAEAAEMAALESEATAKPVRWSNPGNPGRYGSAVAGNPYKKGDKFCRPYSHTIYVDGIPQTARGEACRDGGGWRIVS